MCRWNRPGIALRLLGLLLTAGSASSAPAAPGPTTLSGSYSSTIVDWPKGKTGTVGIVASSSSTTLTSAPIDANGHFTLPLPDPNDPQLKLANVSSLFAPQSDFNPPDQKCVGQGTAIPQNAHYRELTLWAAIESDDRIYLKFNSDPHLPYPVGQKYSALYYFDVPTALDGRVNCTGVKVIYKGTFPAGWSLPAGQLLAGATRTVSFTPDPLPDSVVWHLYDLSAGIGVRLDAKVAGVPGFTISGVTAGRPAERAGVKVADQLVEIDGKDLSALSSDQVVALIRGAANTTVTIGVKRGAETTIQRFKLIRAEIQIP